MQRVVGLYKREAERYRFFFRLRNVDVWRMGSRGREKFGVQEGVWIEGKIRG